MELRKMQYYHAQAAKTDLRRKWQWMATWPIVYRFGENLQILFEHPCLQFRIDLYIPSIGVAIEVDESHHGRQVEADEVRQRAIERELGCEFFRLKVADSDNSLFRQLEDLVTLIEARSRNQPTWQLPQRTTRVFRLADGHYSQTNLALLRESGIDLIVASMVQDLAALDIDTSSDSGPVSPGSGELGFTVLMNGIHFAMSIRSNRTIKVLSTYFEPGVPEKLGLILDGPKNGRCPYWTIGGFERGKLSIDEVLRALVEFQETLAQPSTNLHEE